MNPEPARTHFGPYQVVSRLGKGGMGEVYRAHDAKLGRDVAIKTLPPEYASEPEWRARFRREARMLAALNHPNIAVIHGLDESEGVHYLVMELVEGETLADRIARSGALPLDEALKIGRQVADALEAAHRKSITHRDIKPANIIVSPEGRVKVLDFGLAKPAVKLLDVQATVVENATKTGAIVGTPGYMSPEQLRGTAVDHRTDIWAFGCLLYELLTGQPAFHGETLPDTLAAVVGGEPKANLLPTATPERVRGLLRRCLQKDTAKRASSMTEVREAIDEVLAGHRGVSRRALATMLGAAVIAAAVLPLALSSGLRERLFEHGAERIRTIAVLPLANLSGKPDQEYFADGMTEELITDLANIRALKVISRTSIMRYKGTDEPLPQIARELHVDAIIEGSVQREQGRVRITAQLIDGRTDQNVWAHSYDRDLRSVLALQADIASAIAARVRLALTPAERAQLGSTRSVNPQAYDAYLKGMYFLNKMNPKGFDEGIKYMQQAIGIDPTDPLPYAGLALVYCRMGHERFPDAFSRAEAASRKAVELGGTLAETQLALGEIKLYSAWDLVAAGPYLRSALDLNPSLAEAHRNYSWYLNVLGRTDEAIAEMKLAEDTDPLSAQWAADLGYEYMMAGRYDEAITELRKALELNPGFGYAQSIVGTVYADQGKYQDAIKIGREAGTNDAAWAFPLGVTYARAGRSDEARALAAQLKKKPTPLNAWGLSRIYAALGDKDQAFQWLDKAAQLRISFMPWIVRDSKFAPLWSDPRFKRFVKLINFPPGTAGVQ